MIKQTKTLLTHIALIKMPRNKFLKNRDNKKSYKQVDIQNAVKELQDSKLTIRKASILYQIYYSTL